MSCKKHPKYKAKRYPTSNCLTCLVIYTRIKCKPRIKFIATKIVPNKKLYSRKKLSKLK